jgi:tetratricopeptide (TPR) repeat protein
MASDPTKTLLDQALSSLQRNQPEEAVQILDRLGSKGEEIPDQLSYRGLAYAKMGRQEEATKLLERAVEVAPSESRHHFTLAIHRRQMGDVEGARSEAQATRKLDPKFPGIEDLYSSIGLDVNAESKPTYRDKLFAPRPQKPLYGQFHAFPSLEQAEKQWTTCGWTLVALTFFSVLLLRVHFPLHQPLAGEGNGLPFLGGMLFNRDFMSVAIVFFYVTIALLSAGWSIVDMLDRRARALWLIPLVPFGCLCGLPGIGQAIYMGLGRR